VEIVRLSPSHPRARFEEIAHLHAAEIHHGALPLLGPRFLARLYHEMSRAARTGVWVAVESDATLGFLAGCTDIKAAYRSIFLTGGLPLAWLVVRRLLGRPSLLRKVFAMLAYPFHRGAGDAGAGPPVPARHAELLAVAVSREAQRRGVGRRLVSVFEEHLAAWGVAEGYWATTNIAEEDSNRFYRSLGFKPCGTMRLHDLVLQRYHKALGASSPDGSPAAEATETEP